MFCANFRPEYPGNFGKQKIVRSIAESDSVPRILFEEKEQECLAKDETIRVSYTNDVNLWSFLQKIVRVKLVVSYDVTILRFTMTS